MSKSNKKLALVVCKRPTSTLTKGKVYSAEFIPSREKKFRSYWGGAYYIQYKGSYKLTNDSGNIVTVLASRFEQKK